MTRSGARGRATAPTPARRAATRRAKRSTAPVSTAPTRAAKPIAARATRTVTATRTLAAGSRQSAARPAPRANRRTGHAAAEAQLRAHALAKPEATEHFPWGERAIKVKGKVFVFMHRDAERLSLTAKLPETGAMALLLPFAEPTGYGLGKAGWVSARFDAGEPLPLDILTAWIDESYGAVAPAKLAAIARGAAPTAPAPAPAPRRTGGRRRA